jgi:hypothetical protein
VVLLDGCVNFTVDVSVFPVCTINECLGTVPALSHFAPHLPPVRIASSTGISQFYEFVIAKFDAVPFPAHLKGHCTHPFVWIETGADQKIEPIGGRDFFCEWTLKNFAASDVPNAAIVELASTKPSMGDAIGHVKAMAGSTAECAQSKPKAK